MSGGNIDIAFFIFGHRTDGRGHKSVSLGIHFKASLLHQSHSAVVGTYPQTILTVCIKAYNAGNTRCGIDTFEGVSVISYKTAVTAYPYKAVSCTLYSICLRGGQPVGIVIQYRRVTIVSCSYVNRKFGIILRCRRFFRQYICRSILRC